MAYRHEDLTDEVLEMERIALNGDNECYMECLNNKPLKDRITDGPQSQRDGLILFWHVYQNLYA